MRFRCGLLLLVSLLAACSDSDSHGMAATPTPTAVPASLPLPSQISRREYQQALYAFLGELRYRTLGWRRDKEIRDTGPYRNGTYYGTHPAVRVYYSPEVLTWLEGGRRGDIPDGGIIIKEMYPPPAARYEGVPESALPMPTWTVMTRDAAGAFDGWFWTYFDSNPRLSEPPVPQAPDGDAFPFPYPDSDFGSYCVRCHASAESQMTFITTENIEGFPGEPLRYDVDESWRDDPDGPGEDPHPHDDPSDPPTPTPSAHDFVNADWLAFYNQLPPTDLSAVAAIPPVSTDRVPANGHDQFVTSDQCESCHSGDTSPFGPNLMVDRVDVSPFNEWRWSMMGLAGRDPIFYAQLESETTRHGGVGSQLSAAQIENFCLHCHGVMGQRQFVADHPTALFSVDDAMSGRGDPRAAYGGLARDGISCAACHRARDDAALPLSTVQNGNFMVDPPDADGVLTIYGPFDKPTEYSMLGTLGMRPVHGAHMDSSRMCATCHTVFLPVLDSAGHVIAQDFEQATYLEWVNSAYAQGSTARSCQDCHMPDTFAGEHLAFKLANIQDQDFPPTSFLAPLPDITVEKRDGYRRHFLQGSNVFALELFRSFPDVLGVRLKSFMSGVATGLPQAIDNAVQQAANQTATVDIVDVTRSGDALTASVRVTNLTGHRLPSGVGFRRLVLEVLVLDGDGQVVWGSGRTDQLGVVVDAQDVPLRAERHEIDPATGEQAYEPHYQVVSSQSSAQIYEELSRDPEGAFTTSFLARGEQVKDNRLLPTGWSADGPPDFAPEFAEATRPHGTAASDPDFTDGSGSDTVTYVAQIGAAAAGPLEVRATLYYQAIPPRYLIDRFSDSSGPATRRLHYLTSHLDDSATAFAGWKLPLAAASRQSP